MAAVGPTADGRTSGCRPFRAIVDALAADPDVTARITAHEIDTCADLGVVGRNSVRVDRGDLLLRPLFRLAAEPRRVGLDCRLGSGGWSVRRRARGAQDCQSRSDASGDRTGG